jgi:homoserine O-acetyltransferase
VGTRPLSENVLIDSQPGKVFTDMSALQNFPVTSLRVNDDYPALFIAYTTHGRLNCDADNVILFPTYYTGTHSDNERLIGKGRALDTDKYFIVVPNLIGNGVSSSPGNTSAPLNGANFPRFTIHQNVVAQQQLLQTLGINKIKLAVGWSMGGLQAYHWYVHQPAMVERALIICATAKTSIHNHVFLEGVKAALTADSTFDDGHYHAPPATGLKAFARVYAGWAYSQDFFRGEHFRDLGFDTAEALLQDWEKDHLGYDADDLLCALDTWQTADIGNHPDFHGNTIAALNSIESKVWLMPCEQDLYFRHEDNREELRHLRNAEYRGYQSVYGHCSAGPGRFDQETALIESTITKLLQSDI